MQRRIITIEDPVEYRLPGVSQIDVKPEIDLTFANGLRTILRQDPNVVMVGEMRDFETAEIAIRAAHDGPSRLFHAAHERRRRRHHAAARHGRRAVSRRLVVRAFIAQRLVRTICPQCVEEHEYDPAVSRVDRRAERVRTSLQARRGLRILPTHRLPRPHRHLRDLRPVNERLREEIVHKASGGVLKAVAVAEAMITLRQDGWRRVRLGMTTVEEVIRVTQEDEAIAETD